MTPIHLKMEKILPPPPPEDADGNAHLIIKDPRWGILGVPIGVSSRRSLQLSSHFNIHIKTNKLYNLSFVSQALFKNKLGSYKD